MTPSLQLGQLSPSPREPGDSRGGDTLDPGPRITAAPEALGIGQWKHCGLRPCPFSMAAPMTPAPCPPSAATEPTEFTALEIAEAPKHTRLPSPLPSFPCVLEFGTQRVPDAAEEPTILELREAVPVTPKGKEAIAGVQGDASDRGSGGWEVPVLQ